MKTSQESIDQITATVDDSPAAVVDALRVRMEELEHEVTTLRAQLAAQDEPPKEPQPAPPPLAPATVRKTLPPLVTQLLAKNNVEVQDNMEATALDKALGQLSLEQRIAVKMQMARAGLLA